LSDNILKLAKDGAIIADNKFDIIYGNTSAIKTIKTIKIMNENLNSENLYDNLCDDTEITNYNF